MKLIEAIEFNPKESLQKNSQAKKIGMEKLSPFYKFIDAYEYEKYSGGSKFRNGDTLVARITPCLENGKTAFVDFLDDKEIAFGSTEFIVMRAKEGLTIPEYVYYLAISPWFRNKAISLMTGTSGRQRVQVDPLKLEDYNIPSISEQKKIVKLLSNIDRKIKLNNEMNNNLHELCRTNYLRLIEKENSEVSLADLMDYQGGSQPPASEFQKEKNENNVRFVQIRDFETDSYTCYIPNSNKNKLCNKDDILIARYGASLGRICYGLSGAYNVALAKVIPKKEEYKELLRVVLESDDFYNYINQVGQRSAQAGFNAGDIVGYNVIIPDENGLIIFNNIAKKIIEKRLDIFEENKKLSELRNALLPKLMNGEIDLDNVEI